MKVVKFGGSSLANAETILKAKSIVESDKCRKFVVVSAPGKCAQFSRKVTDLLIDAYTELNEVHNVKARATSRSLELVVNRFRQLAKELGVDIDAEIMRTMEEIHINRKHYDFVISRGEYLMARLFATLTRYRFIDAANYVVIKQSGKVNESATTAKFRRCLKPDECVVMGGFYGQSVDGGIKTFSRGGSDYSGAIAAVCLNADVYENFTDTHGVQSANPTLVKGTRNIPMIDFATMHKLSLGGVSVIHPDCVPLLRSHSTPLQVDSTFNPGKFLTIVSHKKPRIKYFCITYETKRNINKDTVEILCVYNKMELAISDLRKILGDIEVYLVKFNKHGFVLLTTIENLSDVINLLHNFLSEL